MALLADNDLGYRWGTFVFLFFFISKASLSEAQLRQRSWLQASMRISSGMHRHLMQACGSSWLI